MNKYNQPASTIAVLPFRNISTNQDLQYFAHGLSEDLITDLSRYSSLQVISSHSTFNMDEGRDISALHVDYLVKGSFRQLGELVKINAQLVLAKDESLIWSHRYEATIDTLLDIQDDISEQLVSALQREIDTNLLSTSRNKPNTNVRAYEYWLMGYEELKKGHLETDNIARGFFQKAMDIDPNYARAYCGMSLSYFNEWSCQLWERWDYSQKGAYEYAKKAVELDDNNYMSMTVLGRLYIYKGAWEKAEHYLRRSLRVNSNDTDNLIQIASCFNYLGYHKEAEKLYKKAMRLNPLNTGWYYSFGSMLYFEMGEFEKSINLGLKTNLDRVMVDMAAFIAGSYYYLGNYEKMKIFWKKYQDQFQKKIMRGNTFEEEDAINWIKNVNPCKNASNLEEFLSYINKKSNNLNGVQEVENQVETFENYFVKKGDIWEMSFDGYVAALPEVKGFYDIQKLLIAPFKELHCSELMHSPLIKGEKVLVFDEQAKEEYKTKLIQLQSDIEEAQLMNDEVRTGHLQENYDQLVDHLSKSLGIGGKTRKVSDQIDKARSALTWRIRAAIKKIIAVHEPLGNHLSNTIKTGVFCIYRPEKEIRWNS